MFFVGKRGIRQCPSGFGGKTCRAVKPAGCAPVLV
jgi:hypothetical protein